MILSPTEGDRIIIHCQNCGKEFENDDIIEDTLKVALTNKQLIVCLDCFLNAQHFVYIENGKEFRLFYLDV